MRWSIGGLLLLLSLIANAAKPQPAPFTFDAHNEGAVEGRIYGDENLVSVTIDHDGIRYTAKGLDKPFTMRWDQVAAWQPNTFARERSGTKGDFGIGIQGPRYFSFRTRSRTDFASAVKALKAFAPLKERPGIG